MLMRRGGITQTLILSCHCARRALSTHVNRSTKSAPFERMIPDTFELDGLKLNTDSYFNISSGLRNLYDRRLLYEPLNPLCLLRQQIVEHLHREYRKPGNRSPIFTICDKEPRLVSVFENFDSLLTPPDHISRRPSDTYYVNRDYCLRAHTSAHQFELLKRGLDNFVVIGDVYRRDEIDRTHFPCFHQIEGLRTFASPEELFGDQFLSDTPARIFAPANSAEFAETAEKQAGHTLDTAKVLVLNLKCVLEGLARALFGADVQFRWVDSYFPFTHPSFELEILFDEKWLEILGCGVVRQEILRSAGAGAKVGWAFGMGLERIAMALFGIPDIRLFWLRDSGFLNQFKDLKREEFRNFRYRPISQHPQLTMDISFWIPMRDGESCESSDFLARMNDLKSDVRDVIRLVGGTLVEQLELIDEFHNKKKALHSHCYRITYRSYERALSKEEMNVVHAKIGRELATRFGVIIR